MRLEDITVASPCHANWSSMTGDERSRHCQQCQLQVYNLSAMSRADAEALVAEKEDKLCVRFYKRADGTVLTQDCPVGVKKSHRQRRLWLRNAAAAITVVTLVGSFAVVEAKSTSILQEQLPPKCQTQPGNAEWTMGGRSSQLNTPTMGEPSETSHEPQIMGQITPPAQKPPIQLMGKPAPPPKK